MSTPRTLKSSRSLLEKINPWVLSFYSQKPVKLVKEKLELSYKIDIDDYEMF